MNAEIKKALATRQKNRSQLLDDLIREKEESKRLRMLATQRGYEIGSARITTWRPVLVYDRIDLHTPRTRTSAAFCAMKREDSRSLARSNLVVIAGFEPAYSFL